MISAIRVQWAIVLLCGLRSTLDADLARGLYDVPTKRFNEAFKQAEPTGGA